MFLRSCRLPLVSVIGLLGLGCRGLPPADVGFVTKWTETAYALARAERLSPPVASRVSAYASIALYEGWAAGSDSLRSLSGQLNNLGPLPKPVPDQKYDWSLVAVEAQTVVLRDLYREGFPSTQVAITKLHDSLVSVRRTSGVGQAVIDRSIGYGTSLGQAIASYAKTDGFTETRGKSFTMPVGPQYWVPTATEAQYRAQNLSGESDFVAFDNPTAAARPGEMSERSLTVNRPKRLGVTSVPGINVTKPVEPYWGDLRPFALASADSCQAPLPEPFSPTKGSSFYQQALLVYQASKELTEEQKQIAYFWADNPGESGTPAGHWLGIISQVARQLHLSPERAVEAYALVAVSIADSFIGCWRLKYKINLVRPSTYIQRYIDPKWQPLLLTPPFPEFASGHAIQSSAAADVLTALFGDNVSFDDATHVNLGHPPRHFGSFRQAALQTAMSRLYGGIHYPMGNDNGIIQGHCIAKTLLGRVKTRK